ncbi:hypothetical protein GIB67_005581 [Kingdonia uniflora]|uniref:Aldehyde dehydrogenase domain-containing protein n=1 Tax=Kingdonia uniflora TaxID=39325 RepID=A0A7J7LA63_9MAGN|nr:hypothetical protein GIB67_005581 [Kingdonia uniflora]
MINYGGSEGMDFSGIDVALVGILVKSLNLTLSNLDQWMAITKTRLPLVFFLATGEVLPEPLGVVLILSSWNYPISLALDPLIGAIAAGNVVVLKPSELVSACSHLIPVTLELGGKCPVIVDSRLSPSQMQIELMKKTIKRFHGDNPKEPKNMARIVNKHHFERLSGLLQDPVVAASIVHGGSLNEEKMIIEPTILLDPPLDAKIMIEEIFGPLLLDSIARLV